MSKNLYTVLAEIPTALQGSAGDQIIVPIGATVEVLDKGVIPTVGEVFYVREISVNPYSLLSPPQFMIFKDTFEKSVKAQ